MELTTKKEVVMKKLILLLLCGFIHLSASNWTVLIYMNARDVLQDAALLNLNELARGGTNEHADIYVQLNAYGNVGWRYHIEDGAIVQDGYVALSNDYSVDILDAAEWAFEQSASRYHGIILWGHGYGILTPSYDAATNEWVIEHDAALDACQICKRSGYAQYHARNHRAALLDRTAQMYLSNEQMIALMDTISHNIIHKKIDFLGFDMCLGASIEHAYQLQPYAHYLMACQNCELKDGFEYYGFARRLKDPMCTPLDLARGMAADYDAYYQQHAPKGEYTVSILDCAQAPALKSALDVVFGCLYACVTQSPTAKEIVKTIRAESVSFCFVPMYTDLLMILQGIQEALPLFNDAAISDELKLGLAYGLAQAQTIAQNMVIANVTGYAMQDAHGMSIYFPYSHVDSSYRTVQFAQESAWLALLDVLTADE